jgi:hypothetical protein
MRFAGPRCRGCRVPSRKAERICKQNSRLHFSWILRKHSRSNDLGKRLPYFFLRNSMPEVWCLRARKLKGPGQASPFQCTLLLFSLMIVENPLVIILVRWGPLCWDIEEGFHETRVNVRTPFGSARKGRVESSGGHPSPHLPSQCHLTFCRCSVRVARAVKVF